MDMLIGGRWQSAASGRTEDVTSPSDGAQANGTPYGSALAYGGLKASGIGREGPRSAVAEMTDVKTAILPGRPW